MDRMKPEHAFDSKRLLDIEELCFYIGVAKSKARAWGKEIGAERRIGTRVLYDRVAIDAAIDAQARQSEQEAEAMEMKGKGE